MDDFVDAIFNIIQRRFISNAYSHNLSRTFVNSDEKQN